MLLHHATPPGTVPPHAPDPADPGSLLSRLGAAGDDCGCSLGARCMAIGFVAALVALGVQYGAFTPAFFWRSPLALVVAFLCAGAGKSVGIARARRRRTQLQG